jgi:methionine-rich copper-binding protein CopC
LKFSLRRARMTGALTAVLALTALAGTAPAQAHDALASTSPADGQTITINPGKVSITLTNAPETGVPGSNTIKVIAPDGHTASSGDISVDGATVSIAADVDHPGKHTVQWRAVSADGHPIEGSFTFTYAAEGETHSEAATPATSAASAPATTAAETPAPETQASAPASSQTQDNTGWFIGIGAVLLVLVAVGAYLIGRRARTGNGSTN